MRHSLTGFRQGDHVCSLYGSADEQVTAASQFIGDGLRRGERCVYAAATHEAFTPLRTHLFESGIDVSWEEGRRSLILVTRDEAWFMNGRFTPERIIQAMNGGIDEALVDGYSGFRACGDLSWLQDGSVGAGLLGDYESRCTDFFRCVRGLGLCLYDRRLSTPLLETALATHPSLLVDGRHHRNPYFAQAPRANDALASGELDRQLAALQHAEA